MARIRTIKPEFWDSPDTAKASHTARLFFVALWNWADDYGKGTASPKALIGFAFPNDDSITVADYPSLVSELQSAWKVVFYEAGGRPYYYIPGFTRHQRTEKRAASRIPDPPDDVSAGQSNSEEPSVDSDGSSDAIEGGMFAGTGEQGNIGTGEEGTSEAAAASSDETPDADDVPTIFEDRSDIERVCLHLVNRMVGNGYKRPAITNRWRMAAKQMLDSDGRTEQNIIRAIDWAHDSDFWRANIKSIPTLRKQYDTLRLQAEAERKKQTRSNPADDHVARYLNGDS